MKKRDRSVQVVAAEVMEQLPVSAVPQSLLEPEILHFRDLLFQDHCILLSIASVKVCHI